MKTAAEYLKEKGIQMTDFISSSTYDAVEKALNDYASLKVQSALGEQGKWVSVEIIGIIQEMDWNNDGEVNAQNLIKKIREYKYLPPPPNK